MLARTREQVPRLSGSVAETSTIQVVLAALFQAQPTSSAFLPQSSRRLTLPGRSCLGRAHSGLSYVDAWGGGRSEGREDSRAATAGLTSLGCLKAALFLWKLLQQQTTVLQTCSPALHCLLVTFASFAGLRNTSESSCFAVEAFIGGWQERTN